MSKLDKVAPTVHSLEAEEFLRRTFRGKYHADYTDPRTGEVIDEDRFTRFEYPDPVPVEVPVYLRRPESTDDRIRRLMTEQREWIAWQQRAEESEDDERDYDDDGFDPDLPVSPYEFIAEASHNIKRQDRIKRYKERRAKDEPRKPADEPEISPPPKPADKKDPPEDKSKVNPAPKS